MTEISINTKENSIELKGHSEQSEVCHAISALSAAVGIFLENKVGAKITVDEAYIKIEQPEKACNNDLKYYNDYMDFLTYSINSIDEEYPGNITFKVS